MARCFQRSPKAQEDTERVSREIEDLLRKQRRAEANRTKLLLLGTGDSGKTTFLKQLKRLYKDGFTKAELEQYRWVIPQGNLLVPMQILARHVASCEGVSKSLRRTCMKLLEHDALTEVSAALIASLWRSGEVQRAWRDRAQLGLQLPSQAAYFFAQAERIAEPEWTPSQEDVLRAKLKTTGITEVSFEERGTQFSVVDVGGQRSERRKWLHCFDCVTSVLFLAALDDYDQCLEEDPNVNRLDESLRLFAEVTGSRFFSKNISWILFLNKDDLFRAKLAHRPLHEHCEDFTTSHAPDSDAYYSEALEHLKSKYRAHFKGTGLLYEPYVTCAVDTEKCRRVAAAVLDTVLRNALAETDLDLDTGSRPTAGNLQLVH